MHELDCTVHDGTKCKGTKGGQRAEGWVRVDTWCEDPVTTRGALATAFEGAAVQLMIDDLLKAPEQYAKEEWSDDQAGVGAKPSPLQ